MDPPLVHQSSFPSSAPPSSYGLPEIWQLDSGSVLRRGHFGQNLSFPEPPALAGNACVEESTVTEHSGSHGGRKKRREAAAVAASEDESSKLASTCSGNDTTDCNGKHLKATGSGEENGDLKADAEASSGNGNKTAEQNAQPSEAPRQDYIHVRARRGQATDSHSLAERARREKISERMKILQDLVPGCNKVIGKALVLDEIINYIQSLQRQVEFLSMKLEAVNSRMNTSMEVFPAKDFGIQTFDASGMPFNPQAPREYRQGSPSEWLHMQVGGGGFDRAS